MPYKQYTHCTKTEDFDPLNRPLAIVGGIGGLVTMIVALFVAAAIPVLGIILVLAGGGFMYAAIVATFEYLLGGKLICLGGDKVAIGSVLNTEPPSTKSGVDAMDNDYSINILLCPHKKIKEDPAKAFQLVAEELPDINSSLPANYQDFLVEEQEASRRHNIPYTGYESNPFKTKPNLHIELEGSRIYDTYQAFLAAWGVLVAAAIIAAALASIPVIGWLLALLAMLIGAAIGAAIVGITWSGAADGSVADVDATIGELHLGDILVSYGTWTYDSGHNDTKIGWNELHPVKFLSKAQHCASPDEAKQWEVKIKETFNPNIRGKQQELTNQWEIHPLIDGCRENEVIK